jgi:hypothetical protein
LRDHERRNAITDLRDIADRLRNTDVNLRDSDRVRDGRTLDRIADGLECLDGDD